jgi:DNA primase catalytic core
MLPRFVAGPADWTTPNLLFLFSAKRSPTLLIGWCLVTRPIRALGLCLGCIRFSRFSGPCGSEKISSPTILAWESWPPSPMFASRGKSAMGEDLEKLKQRFSLLDYLRQQNWVARPAGHGSEFVGLCPLHRDTRPSFYVNARKNLSYCHGCGQGGDLLRFILLSRQLSFRQSLAYLQQHEAASADPAAVLEQAATFYQQQLDGYPEALHYLKQRGLHDLALIKELRIGYAPGGSLRRHLTAQGHSCDLLQRLGLLDSQGHDAFYRRVVFPCCQGGRVINLYGRSIAAAFAHRFLPGSKGGLYGWEQVQQCPEVILVEGLFDYAVLWQAGFRHLTCSLGTHLNTHQFQQLCDRPRTVYLTFDVDINGSGQQASQQLAHRLRVRGIAARRVLLPDGHDPNYFFVQGGDARQFQSLLQTAQP